MDDPAPPSASRARPAALLAVRVTPDDVGRRITVRHELLEASPDASLTDVVGVLLAWGEDDVLVVERRDGRRVSVPRALVVAARVVPTPASDTHPAGLAPPGAGDAGSES
jgi:hypothetical protein